MKKEYLITALMAFIVVLLAVVLLFGFIKMNNSTDHITGNSATKSIKNTNNNVNMPPNEAIASCENKVIGDACEFESKDGTLERDLVRTIYANTGVVIENLPKGVLIEWRDGFYVGVNYTDDSVILPIPESAKILIGENPLAPAQAVVWK